MTGAAEVPPAGHPAIRVVAMPADTNANGDIFGGWLVSMMDLAAGTVASQHSKGRAATIAIDGMTFHRPVSVGDVVSVYADLISVGRTSMKIDVTAWRRSRNGLEHERVTHATITFVAIDDQGRPRAVEA
ncbi:acyl-CoA thioesterase [Sphingomonadaceae bacterium G21617-S1]|jgi:acyl-CoA thioesterase YciA|uniref:acyl-CoA thioesterase n=1 Tax=Rhizorhabdus sp. TaxID=1968843 RepID=UPI00121A1714|nr:acyl-CoA thioesterase [Rhizorhabdus sp.]MBD3759165.1 acyl-CoA thioesterase [Rhizorhabdus sp.]MCZ4342067.1 acyl-CoA thioesterase [Sphingomonadaceae bacterium G21617-S1]TAK07018.1 MAG: acyl-CoA thioesterase [Rhizorhabdus sp.]